MLLVGEVFIYSMKRFNVIPLFLEEEIKNEIEANELKNDIEAYEMMTDDICGLNDKYDHTMFQSAIEDLPAIEI
jgi:hypothetical protein